MYFKYNFSIIFIASFTKSIMVGDRNGGNPFFGNNAYLRVLTPVTIDGTTPKIGADDKAIFSETQLPLSAKKFLDTQNEMLPTHLRNRIDIIPAYIPAEKPRQQSKQVAPSGDDIQKMIQDGVEKALAAMGIVPGSPGTTKPVVTEVAAPSAGKQVKSEVKSPI